MFFFKRSINLRETKKIIAQDSHKICADTLLCIFRWILINFLVKEKGLSRTPLHFKLISPFVRLEHRASKDINVFFPETLTVLRALEGEGRMEMGFRSRTFDFEVGRQSWCNPYVSSWWEKLPGEARVTKIVKTQSSVIVKGFQNQKRQRWDFYSTYSDDTVVPSTVNILQHCKVHPYSRNRQHILNTQLTHMHYAIMCPEFTRLLTILSELSVCLPVTF